MNFSKVEIITGTAKLQGIIERLSKPGVIAQLNKIGVSGLTVYNVLGCGIEKGAMEYQIHENELIQLRPKSEIMMVVETQMVNALLDIVKDELYTGHIGDGKIFVSPVDNIVRIRTGEEGGEALQPSALD